MQQARFRERYEPGTYICRSLALLGDTEEAASKQ